jgi:hypothetical protein
MVVSCVSFAGLSSPLGGGYFSQQKSDPLHNPDCCCCYFFTCDIRASLKTTEFAVVPIENQ